MKIQKYMSTKEFATLARVSKHTLFHYDDIGLFSPEIKNDKNYRYYSIDQLETFDTIRILKDLEMPLKEIKEFMDSRNIQSTIELFDIREKQLDQQIQNLKNIKKYIHDKKENLIESKNIDFSSISIQEYPQRYYLICHVKDDSNTSFLKATNEIIQKYISLTNKKDYTVSYIQYMQDIENKVYDNYQNVVLLFSNKIKSKKMKTLPKGRYVVGYHIGPWQTIQESYERLLEYVKQNHIHIDNQFLEFYRIDNLTAKSEDHYVTEINVKIFD